MNLAFTRSGGERNGGLGISRPTQFLVSHSSTTRSEDKPCGRARRGAKGRKGEDDVDERGILATKAHDIYLPGN